MLVTPKTDIVIHGHFYQPPRENPRTGIIDYQASAAPYCDWNEKIWECCYRANAHSRYLYIDHIEHITNNYQYMSFNFGPTLLSWLEENHPDTLEDIIRADRASKERLGHGNAIAQGFNHTILPLDTSFDAELEVEWALAAFEKWFGRESEGFWCPETAINGKTIDILSENGVKFVILSPWQCAEVEGVDGKMIDLKSSPAPYDKAYILTGQSGRTINAFFYHPGLASGISFGHLLRDADNLYKTLLEIKRSDNPLLIHTATDGEIYGHHEPYGDMALCALIEKVQDHDDFTLSNYGTFLEKHPAKLHAVLRSGEEGRGTSWSCSHGVSRWYKDCGCHTGGEEGWNQKWRTPLRQAFENVNRIIVQGLSEKLGTILGPKVSLHEYLSSFGTVASGQETMDSFLKRTESRYPFKAEDAHDLASIAECVRYSLYSFTSCGWFFSDLGGLEPRQNIAYALQAISLYMELTGEDLSSMFLTDMSKAKCNRPEDGNGTDIAKSEWTKTPGALEAVLYFATMREYVSVEKMPCYGYYTLLSVKDDTFTFIDRSSLTHYRATYQDVSVDGDFKATVSIVNQETDAVIYESTATSEDIPERMSISFRDKICVRVSDTFTFEDCDIISKEIARYKKLVHVEEDQLTGSEAEMLGLAFTGIESILNHASLANWKSLKDTFLTLISFMAQSKRDIDRTRLTDLIDRTLLYATKDIIAQHQKDAAFITTLTDFIHILRKEGIPIKLTVLQEAFYPFMGKEATMDMRRLGDELNFARVVEHGRD